MNTLPEPGADAPALIVLTPVFDDWRSLLRLIEELAQLHRSGAVCVRRVLAVNDCSVQPAPELRGAGVGVTVLNLGSNLGHQRAIAVGIAYIAEHYRDFDAVVVMDSDGEDDPAYLPAFAAELTRTGADRIIFAQRCKRSEGWGFRLGYLVYRILFRSLTGNPITFGNFSCIPRPLLERVARVPELWNHFSGSILHARIPYTTIATNRSRRYFGHSKMRLSNLVLHGLSAVSIYLDVVVLRILVGAAGGLASVFVLVLLIVGIRLFTDLAIPGWASMVSLALLNFAGLLFGVALLVLMMHLSQRSIVQQPIAVFYQSVIASVDAGEADP